MRTCVRVVVVAAAFLAPAALGQEAKREPHIGYLYPAGGQAGATLEVIAGGQNLRGANGDVCASGDGIRATAVEYYRPIRNLNGDERKEIARRMALARDKRLAEQKNRTATAVPAAETDTSDEASAAPPGGEEPVKLPGHPLLDRIDGMSLRELAHLQHLLANFSKKQLNPQIAEMVRIEVRIEPGARPGPREIRLQTAGGLTNPMVFEVNTLPEVQELEPNDPRPGARAEKTRPLELPVLLNGQILPGDVDRFALRCRGGQSLVIETHARSLAPYLADAVPGWFQAALTLYDARGNEVAYVDDFRFDPDPVLHYEIPKDGVYHLEIRDSIFRGREDFVYRISVGEQPFITSMFPLGGRAGDTIAAKVDGWNLPADTLRLNTDYGVEHVRSTVLEHGDGVSNAVLYAVDTLEESLEAEPNNAAVAAQAIAVPRIVNGRIDAPGDVDVFAIEGRAGDALVAEVQGRRLRSPLDSLVRVIDASGAVVAWNDDFEDNDEYLYRLGGLLTHDADSWLRTELPADGTYYVEIADAQGQGGSAYAYRLRVGPPEPDFALRVTPASVNASAGLAVPVCVHVLRRDGFDGEIQMVLNNAPEGFVLSGGRIPAGKRSIWMTLSAPARASEGPVAIQLEGRAMIGGREVRRRALPADELMQAFLYRHLAPAGEFMVAVRGGRQGAGRVALVDNAAVQIPAGGSAEVRVKAPQPLVRRTVKLALVDPPAGLALGEMQVVPEGLAFVLTAEAGAAAGLSDNVIVEAYVERPSGKGAARKMQRVPAGTLPAIPVEIVAR